MTVNKLHAILGKIIAGGDGRTLVSVHKESFNDNRESDGCVILPVEGCEVVMVLQSDDDGGTKLNVDGSERYKRTCVIHGTDYLPMSKIDLIMSKK